MKVWNTIMKITLALATIAGIVYVVATYGDKIVAWAKKLLSRFGCDCDCCCPCDDDCENCNCTDDCEDCQCNCGCDACESCDFADVEEEAAPAEESAEVPIEEGAVVAEADDFEG